MRFFYLFIYFIFIIFFFCTVRVKCLAQEQNTVSPALSGTWTATCRSGVEWANHEPTVSLLRLKSTGLIKARN